jgi:threonylcarbamoyladenosine tRNA methylthiotransferase MtaB
MRFFIRNFGCRATQADGSELRSAMVRAGWEPARGPAEADLVILNTCTVTASADEDARREARRVRRDNPAARILVTGCYAERAPEEAASLPGVTWVVGNPGRLKIPELVGAQAAGLPDAGEILEERTRPNLKIQDGCNNRCTFCIIPSVRGPSRSTPPDRIVEQARDLGRRYREIVLSGVNLGRWGREPGIRMRLADLLRRLLAETGVERLRLSSVEPMDLTDDLLGLMASTPRIARHVHAPLQSGSDAVLRRMRRWYRARHYADRIRKARQWMPDAAIGADVMVGFPGETEAEFEESRAFIESLPFTYLHVFTYSERPGTPAAAMPDPVPARERKRRNRVLRELAARKNLEFRRSMIGRRLSAVTIGDGAIALTGNYLKVRLARPREPNLLIDVEIGGLAESALEERRFISSSSEPRP